jgi:hypothetical protein
MMLREGARMGAQTMMSTPSMSPVGAFSVLAWPHVHRFIGDVSPTGNPWLSLPKAGGGASWLGRPASWRLAGGGSGKCTGQMTKPTTTYAKGASRPARCRPGRRGNVLLVHPPQVSGDTTPLLEGGSSHAEVACRASTGARVQYHAGLPHTYPRHRSLNSSSHMRAGCWV